ncbi:hypothetical protein Vretimale_521 [Volvox reticuliferus]|uniref:Uncharacterized protein n=1 Tax=Volvox reticuliferus TaxID=1737510 RepID=A0A8J4D2C0_9CHLO|nr:hypothetical protein Vretimale_521 [Volvox reticuliferus]
MRSTASRATGSGSLETAPGSSTITSSEPALETDPGAEPGSGPDRGDAAANALVYLAHAAFAAFGGSCTAKSGANWGCSVEERNSLAEEPVGAGSWGPWWRQRPVDSTDPDKTMSAEDHYNPRGCVYLGATSTPTTVHTTLDLRRTGRDDNSRTSLRSLGMGNPHLFVWVYHVKGRRSSSNHVMARTPHA